MKLLINVDNFFSLAAPFFVYRSNLHDIWSSTETNHKLERWYVMTLDEIYAGIVKKLDFLSVVTGEKWDLLWSEKEFGYQIARGSNIVHRAPWVRLAHEQITREVNKLNKKNGKETVAHKCDCAEPRRLHIIINVSVRHE